MSPSFIYLAVKTMQLAI